MGSIDTIFVIGNGFDLWQGLDTSYGSFQAYYLSHRDEIMRKLHVKPHVFIDKSDKEIVLSDVELVYGGPFDPSGLSSWFWGMFETSMGIVDSQELNLFFGKDRGGLRTMRRSVRNARRVLTRAFCDWIASIHVSCTQPPIVEFGDRCLFVTFNYTDALTKRFGVDPSRVFHVHGWAGDERSMVFGHSCHPQMPVEELYRFGGRFRGLYLVESLLYETDKHVKNNIALLRTYLALNGVIARDIEHVYVLGHSISEPDMGYFEFLAATLGCKKELSGCGAWPDERGYVEASDSIEELDLRLQYAINRYGYGLSDDEIEDAQHDATMRRYHVEQSIRDEMLIKDFCKQFGMNASQSEWLKTPMVLPQRSNQATWHVSYHDESSKKHYEKVLGGLGCERVHYWPSIEDCLAEYLVLPGC